MIITLNHVIGNGKHRGKTVKEVMDCDPESIISWMKHSWDRFDKAASDYWNVRLRKYEESKLLEEEVFLEEEAIF